MTRKKVYDDKVKFLATLERAELKRVDAVRGKLSRVKWIQIVIRAALARLDRKG